MSIVALLQSLKWGCGRVRRCRPNFLPCLRALDDRTLLSTCHVTRLTDQGIGNGFRGDLRYCINKINTEPGPDAIDFTVNGTINLTGVLPDLDSEIDIQGPGADLLTVRRDTGGNYRIFTVAIGAPVQISGVTITNGLHNDKGGGIWNAGTLVLNDTIVIANTSVGFGWLGEGGGIWNGGTLTINGGTVSGNQAGDYGLGGGIGNYGAVTLNNSIVSGNLATTYGSGGGIGSFGTLTLYNSIVSDNTGHLGGGMFTGIGPATIIASTVSGNLSVGGVGGGIANSGNANSGTLRIQSSTITDNESGVAGGGIWNDRKLTVENSTFAHNKSPRGGGIWSKGTLAVSNSTISNNLASSDGGAIATEGGTLAVRNSTIAHNNSGGLGGGIAKMQGTLFMTNTIVAKNSAGGGPDIIGGVTSGGYNLIGDTAGSAGYAPTDILDVDPLLGPLSDNGGPTLTHALLPRSPAIDAGDPNIVDPPEWDQRGPGYPRIVNGTIDIGSFEVQTTGAPGVDRIFAQPFVPVAFRSHEIARTRSVASNR